MAWTSARERACRREAKMAMHVVETTALTTIPIRYSGEAMTKEPRGCSTKNATPAEPSAVAHSAGPTPAHQAVRTTTGKMVTNAIWSPRKGSRSNRAGIARPMASDERRYGLRAKIRDVWRWLSTETPLELAFSGQIAGFNSITSRQLYPRRTRLCSAELMNCENETSVAS